LKFENKDEDEDSISTELNLDLKCKRSIPSLEGDLIDLNNPLQTQ